MNQPLPVHLIAGPLGVGKTSAILDYLKRHAGWEKVGVVVNDFGPLGLDDAVMQSEPGAMGSGSQVVMIPGGCVCCTAAAGLALGLEKVLKIKGLTRVIVEPSGIAAPSDVIDTLRASAERWNIQVRPVIGILDAVDAHTIIEGRMPLYSRLVESSDHLVFNRTDLAGAEKTRLLQEWAAALYPPKLSATPTHHGMLPDRLFEPAAARPVRRVGLGLAVAQPVQQAKPHHGHHDGHDHPTDHADGLRWEPQIMFRDDALDELFGRLLEQGVDGRRPSRVKGIFFTDQGWVLKEIARDRVFERPSDHRRDSRVDWIAPEGQPLDKSLISRLFEACRIDL